MYHWVNGLACCPNKLQKYQPWSCVGSPRENDFTGSVRVFFMNNDSWIPLGYKAGILNNQTFRLFGISFSLDSFPWVPPSWLRAVVLLQASLVFNLNLENGSKWVQALKGGSINMTPDGIFKFHQMASHLPCSTTKWLKMMQRWVKNIQTMP